MEPIVNYTKNGFYYQLVKRQGDWAIFRQSTVKDSTAPLDVGVAWEVFKIKVSKEAEWEVTDKAGNKTLLKVEPKECAPSNEEIGRGRAWSCPTLKRAREKLAEAIENEKLNKQNRENKNYE